MKKKLTLLLTFLLVAVLALTLVACGDNNEPGTLNGESKSQVKLESGDVVAEGTFDAGVTLSVSKIDSADENYASALQAVENKQYDEDKVAVYDVSLVKDSAKVQPNGKVKITMPAPFVSENGYITYHINGDNVDELATTYADGKISFETSGFSYFVIAGTIDENTPTYTLVDKNGNEDENGEYVLFGTYPQIEVKDTDIKTALAQKAGALPQNGNNGKWTSYKYYYAKALSDDPMITATEMSNEIDFMWYIDVKYNGDLYRGVYFTHYRPAAAMGKNNVLDDGKSGSGSHMQSQNGYSVENLYWFKHEPILWKIIHKQDGKAQLLCMSALDAQPYTLVTEQSKERFEDALDKHYVYYNAMPGVPQKTLATNYEYSAIRNWLNNDFYKNAFNSKQKKLINETLLDNESGEVGGNTSDKVFIPSIAELEGVTDFYRKATGYAKVQGIDADYSRTSCDYWYLRDTYYVLRFSDKESLLSYDSDRYYQMCTVREGSLYNPINGKPGFSGVTYSANGVVPSLWITL